MKTAAYIETLTTAGVDPKMATAYGKAIETMIEQSTVSRDYLDAKLDAKIADLRAAMYQALIVQTLGLAGLFVAIAKFAN